jgi:alginate O-acetyltransferase complex protein AlgI
MFFNSLHFLIFLPIVFMLYWFVVKNKLTLQNILLLLASYFFYACWDWRFLFLLIFSTVLDYFTGIRIGVATKNSTKRIWFWTSISINLGFLAVFKYYNFFVTSFDDALSACGIHIDVWLLNVILPVGISFYTFHGVSYVIDIYKERIKPERNFIDYSVFVSFFPLLVAGPIERATHLLPQIKKPRIFDSTKAVDGLRQILWGLVKKIVIADQCAEVVNLVYGASGDFNGITHLIAAIFFSFQIYCDFSGYSDIALGVARLFGIELLKNFSYPYFSRDIAEFWRRWHISLSSWFRDYLYFPLGGSVGGTWMKIRNTLIIFLVSGFWHGANWTFIVWGFLNALFILPSIIVKSNRKNLNSVAEGRFFPSLNEFLSMLLTFMLSTFAWIFFRSKTLGEAFEYISAMCTHTMFSMPQIKPVFLSILLVCFVLIEWLGRNSNFALQTLGLTWAKPLRWSFYLFLVMMIGSHIQIAETAFIYFQF